MESGLVGLIHPSEWASRDANKPLSNGRCFRPICSKKGAEYRVGFKEVDVSSALDSH